MSASRWRDCLAESCSRPKTRRAAVKERDLADVRSVEEHHQHPREAEAVPAVRRAAVAELADVVLERLLGEALLADLREKDLRPVLALRARRDFDPLPEEVEAIR